jgi:hypothetical protein
MTATVRKDGSIEFNSGLLSIATITREAVRVFIDSHEKTRKLMEQWETADRVNKLRESCGADPVHATMRIKMYLPERV